MVINDIKIELLLGEGWKHEALPMFVYMLRVNGTLLDFEYATLDEAKAAGEDIVNNKANFLG